MSRIDETRYIKWHETCKSECRLDKSICNNKQLWNDDNYPCESKELLDKGICDKGYAWNPSNCSVNVINHLILVSIWIMKL